MATNNVFKTTDIMQRERHVHSITSFGGVDYTSNPLNISPNKAVEIDNLIKRDDVNQKRYGWEEVLKLPQGEYITGVWEFIASDYQKHIIAYTYNGTNGHFYEIKNLNSNNPSYTLINSNINFTNEKVCGFENKKKMYFLTGVKYIVIDIENNNLFIDEVSKNAYIPTLIDSVREISNDTMRKAYEDYNLLSSYIKVVGFLHSMKTDDYDKIAGGEKPTPSYYRYVLGKNLYQYEVGFPYTKNEITSTYKPRYEEFLNEFNNIKLFYNGNTYNAKILYQEFTTTTQNVWTDDLNKITTSTARIRIGFDIGLNKFAWFEKTGFGDDASAALDFNFDPSEEEQFIVQYAVRDASDYANQIDKCTIGCLYGFKNNNRLFVSGNPDKPNMDWHSSASIENDADITYFSDLDYCAYGTESTAIKGYSILNDGNLCVLKEESNTEPTIYFRTAKMVTAMAYDGSVAIDANGNTFEEEAYALSTGNIGEGLINTNSFTTFNHDSVFLSKNGLFGITLGDTINSNIKYARERSRFINPVLRRKDLSSAATIVYDNKYFIGFEDGTVYILDSRYKTQLNDDVLNTYQYECYKWTNIKVKHFFIINDILYFSSPNGTVNKFLDKIYKDRVKVVDKGSIAFSLNNEEFICNDLKTANVEDNEILLMRTNANIDVLFDVYYQPEQIPNETYIIVTNKQEGKFKIMSYADNFYVVAKINSTGSEKATFFKEKNVESLYLTAAFSLGTTLRMKNIYRYSLTNNTIDGSYYEIGVRAGQQAFNNMTQVYRESNGIDFDLFTFNDVKFDSQDYAKSYMFNQKIRNVNFIQFLFTNNSDLNMSVSSLSVEYTIGFGSRGER